MKITFDEILKRDEFLHQEIMNSIPTEVLEKAMSDRFFEVNLVINGTIVDCKVLNKLFQEIERYINEEAEERAKKKFSEASLKIDKITDIVDEAIKKIADETNISLDEND